MNPPDPDLWIVVLAGGVGSRFWPVSTEARPKQLLPLASDQPLVTDTVERALALVPESRLRVIANRSLEAVLTSALPQLSAESFLWEPAARGTAPALTWAAWEVARQNTDAVLISLHSDHVIDPLDAFLSDLQKCAAAAKRHGVLATIGVRPDRADPGYGYVQPGKALDDGSGAPVRRVERFHEKPNRATAEEYCRLGYVWNSGIFVWKASSFLDEVRAHTPEIADHLHLLEADDVAGFFDAVPKSNVDDLVLERSARVAMADATFLWDDVGSWEALARTRDAGEGGNVVVGEGVFVESSDNIVFCEDARVALFGVEGLVVVRTPNMTMVTTREGSRDLKRLFERLPPDWRSPET